MGIKTGTEFEIEAIVCTERKVVGGTAKTWQFLGKGGQAAQFDDDWQRAWRPKIGGWIVCMYDPTQPNRPTWIEYQTPTKRAKELKAAAKHARGYKGILIKSQRGLR